MTNFIITSLTMGAISIFVKKLIDRLLPDDGTISYKVMNVTVTLSIIASLLSAIYGSYKKFIL